LAWVDFAADYKSTAAPPPPEPDPFANYVEPAGNLTPQNYAAWNTPAPVAQPAAAPVSQNKWNEEYQAWEDQSGNLWDSTSGLWYSINDPSNPLVYRPEVGWQNIPEYNDYNTELNSIEAYKANPIESTPSWFTPQPLGRQISAGEWYNVDSAMSAPNNPPRAAFVNYDLATSKNVPFPLDEAAYQRDLQGEPIDRTALRQTDPALPGYGADSLSKILKPDTQMFGAGFDRNVMGPLADKAGDAYNWYTRNIQNPVAETGAQLTPAFLSAAKLAPPIGGLVSAGAALTGYDTEGNALRGIKDLGSAISEPGSFVETQNQNLAERPAWQQMAATSVYDPLNLVGAGLGTKALGSGALEGGGLLSTILRGGAKLDKGIDAAQTAVFSTALKPLGAALKPVGRTLASEAGSLPASLAARGALTTGFGAFGYATADDDASLREHWGRAIAFGAIPAVGPEATDLAARLYGKMPDVPIPFSGGRSLGLASHGIGRNSVLEDALQAEVLRDAGVTPPIHLPEFKEPAKLPLRTRISNATWALVGKNNASLRANIDNPQVLYPMMAFEEANSRIPLVADDMVKTAGDDYVRMVEIDKDGYQLGANGQRMPALDRNGHVRTILDPNSGQVVPVFAGPRDVAYHVNWYETNGYITPEVAGAIRKLASITDEIAPSLKAFKIMPEAEANVGADGVYISRGQIRQEKVPRFRREPTSSRIPGSDKAQDWMTEGESLLAGNRYDHPVEAMRKYAKDQLDKINKANLSTNLSYVKVESALSEQDLTLGDLQIDREAQGQLDQTIKDIKAAKKEIKKLTLRKARVDRDARLANRWVTVNERRIQSLLNTAADQSLQSAARRTAAQDALTLSRQAYDDAESAAREYLDATAKFAGKNSQARSALAETLDTARKTAREVEGVLKSEVEAEVLDNLHYVADTFAHADAIRKAVAADIDRLSNKLAALPLAERERVEHATKFFLDKAKTQFGDSLSELRKQKNAAIAAAKRETAATENIRSRITQGKVDELEGLVERRVRELKGTLTYSKDLQERLDELEAKLLPLKDHRRELKDIIKRSEVFRRELKESGIATGTFDTSVVGNNWTGVPVPNEIANAVNKYKVTPGPQRKVPAMLMSIYDGVNDLFRFMGATADVSRTAIQGLLGIGENPDITRKGLVAGVKTLADPEYEWTYLKNLEAAATKEGLPSVAQAVGRGKLEIAHNEYLFRGTTDENSLLANLAKKKPLSWFETMFSTPGNIERLERFYDYMRAAKLSGQDVNDLRVIRDAASAANMVTGRSSHGVLAPVIGERGSSRVLFAGRFVQSQLETVFNAMFVGGLEGDVARRSLLRLALGGTALTYMINEAAGEETDWRPIVDGIPNPNFARIRVAGHDVSLFGPWDSLVKGLIATYQGDPGSFLRSKMAPATGIAYDLSAGKWKTPLGDKVGFNMETADQYMPAPFGLSDTIRQGFKTDWRDPTAIGELAAGAVLNAGGLKNSPLSPRERYNRELTGAYPDWEPKDADGKPLNYIQPEDPLDDPLFLREYAASHPKSVPGPASALGKELEEVKTRWQDALKKNVETFANDGRTLGEWKAVRHDLKLQQRTALEPILEKMKQSFGDKEPEPGTPAAWLDSYMETFNNSMVDEVLNYNLLDKYQAEWLKANGPEAQDYIDQLFLAGANSAPEREYLTAMQQLNEDGYFDGKLPRYIGMISDLSDEEITKARALVSGYEEKHPELQGQDFRTKAYVVLKPLGFDIQQIIDVSNSGKDAYTSYEFKIYKLKNPALIEWLDDGNYYSTLKAVSSR